MFSEKPICRRNTATALPSGLRWPYGVLGLGGGRAEMRAREAPGLQWGQVQVCIHSGLPLQAWYFTRPYHHSVLYPLSPNGQQHCHRAVQWWCTTSCVVTGKKAATWKHLTIAVLTMPTCEYVLFKSVDNICSVALLVLTAGLQCLLSHLSVFLHFHRLMRSKLATLVPQCYCSQKQKQHLSN